jgi:hypothetical protein
MAAQSVLYRVSSPCHPMTDMGSLTEVAGIDIKVVVTEVSGETAGMMERTEEVVMSELTATLPCQLSTWSTRARGGSGRGSKRGPGADGSSKRSLWCCRFHSSFGRCWRNGRDESLRSAGQSVPFDLCPRCNSSLRADVGTKLQPELQVLLLKIYGIVAIVLVLKRTRICYESMYVESESHGLAPEFPGSGQGSTLSSADRMSGRDAGSTHADGSRKENNRVIGTVLEYRTKAAAERAAEALRININSTTPRTSVLGMTFGELVMHHIARELDVDQQQLEFLRPIPQSRGIAAISSAGFYRGGERLRSLRWSLSSSKTGSLNWDAANTNYRTAHG